MEERKVRCYTQRRLNRKIGVQCRWSSYAGRRRLPEQTWRVKRAQLTGLTGALVGYSDDAIDQRTGLLRAGLLLMRRMYVLHSGAVPLRLCTPWDIQCTADATMPPHTKTCRSRTAMC